ncbi:MSHA biogenesis protein MshD [Shewanella sp. OPT22]|nr:MSHA biogenesis protein MshD [Shewanella sp. OPT22]
MLVLGIGLVMMATMLLPQADRAAETLHRVRAVELASTIMTEVWSQRFDPNTGDGGVPACDSVQPLSKSCFDNIGTVTKARAAFNNLNDFNGLTQNSMMLGSTTTYAQVYPNYQFNVVIEKGDEAGGRLLNKVVVLNITTPTGEQIRFDAVRSNY